ncbi:MAG: hypothetical protein ACLPJJ_01495 [Acidocella sp.]|uniref:hypothetical protein n=1 Tax=Acidocella sp. TaxID=50710 RepID=UPI003FC6D822
MGTVFSRANGSFTARVRMKGHPQQAETFASRAEAKRWIADIEAAMRAGAFKEDETGGITLGQAIDAWAKDARKRLKKFDVEEARIRKLKAIRIGTGVRVAGQALEGRITDIAVKGADSDDRAHVFRSDAAQRSDLIARR